MEEKTSGPNEDISNECDQEDCIMAMFETVSYAFASKIHKHQIRERIDNLCSIYRNNVVLRRR